MNVFKRWRIRSLRLGSNDILVMKINVRISYEEACAIRARTEKIVGNTVLVVSEHAELGVISKPEALPA